MASYLTTKYLARSTVKQVLRPLAPYLPHRATAPSWKRSFAILKRCGLYPKTIFDIGVAYGTPRLYSAFPDAFYYLIDPTRESLPYMQKIVRTLHGEVFNLALGDRDGEVEMEIRHDIAGSTLLEDFGPRDFRSRVKVPMRRLDTLIGTFERPALCKIDVQGAEMLVLKGMEGHMGTLDALVVEASSITTLKGGPEVYDVMRFMKEHGFVVFDILSLARRPLDGAMAQLDILFVPENSFLRKDRRWAARA